MKTLKVTATKYGWNVEVFQDGKLINWRCGLTKKGAIYYQKYFEKFNDLDGCGEL